jgi:hypothetical protein
VGGGAASSGLSDAFCGSAVLRTLDSVPVNSLARLFGLIGGFLAAVFRRTGSAGAFFDTGAGILTGCFFVLPAAALVFRNRLLFFAGIFAGVVFGCFGMMLTRFRFQNSAAGPLLSSISAGLGCRQFASRALMKSGLHWTPDSRTPYTVGRASNRLMDQQPEDWISP